MIQAQDFVESARVRGFAFYAGVPCSFLKPFINYVIDDSELTYVSSANEGDAVATAAGAALAGQRSIAMMQNSGLGNAVSPLTSLNYVFRLPVLLIVTWRGMPGLTDEPQHALMGQITQSMLETMQIPSEIFPESAADIEPALRRATAHMDATGRPYALVMKKGTVAAHELRSSAAPPRPNRELQETGFDGVRPTRSAVLAAMQSAAASRNTVVIASTGYAGRELFALDDRPNQLYMVGSMGCASSLGLGFAMVRPDWQVLVADGDGAALMRMGNLATVGAYGGDNLHHVLLDNEVHDSTGGQGTVSPGVQFSRVATACGYAHSYAGTDTALIGQAVEAAGPNFIHLKTAPGAPDSLPRPNLSPAQVKTRLMNHLGVDVPWLAAKGDSKHA